jgi:hypothetical protein
MVSTLGILKLFGEWDINLRWKMFKFKKNITFKLTIGFLGIVVVSTLLIGIISLNVFKNNIYEIKKNNMKKHALAISKTIEPYILDTSNSKELMDTINLLNAVDNAKVWVVNSDNHVITESDSNSELLTLLMIMK